MGISATRVALRRVLLLVRYGLVLLLLSVIILPWLDWSAAGKPGVIERSLAQYVVSKWIRANAETETNPMPGTLDNLLSGQKSYNDHCAGCHGFDGSGENRFEADFYPPVPKLTGDIQQLSDAEIYFIIANGVRYTGMPGFGAHHSADDIWRTVLWMRRLAKLTPAERAALEAQQKEEIEEHKETMERKPQESPSAPRHHGRESD